MQMKKEETLTATNNHYDLQGKVLQITSNNVKDPAKILQLYIKKT